MLYSSQRSVLFDAAIAAKVSIVFSGPLAADAVGSQALTGAGNRYNTNGFDTTEIILNVVRFRHAQRPLSRFNRRDGAHCHYVTPFNKLPKHQKNQTAIVSIRLTWAS